jgi:hypothetical protein
MTFATRVVQKSRKPHRCLFCENEIPTGSMYIVSPGKDDGDGTFVNVKMCPECAWLVQQTDKDRQFKEGNFTEQRIPNRLRKLRTEYRKDPQKAWEEMQG